MRKTAITFLGTLLIAGSVVQMASATTEQHHTRKVHRTPAVASEQFRNANNAAEVRVSAACQGKEPGNPYDMSTDYQQWTAWQEAGGWDSHHDCW